MLLVINGPIASGRSTLARAVAASVTGSSAVVDLDLVHDMLRAADGRPASDSESWELARRAAAALARTLLDGGIDTVVVDGEFFGPERAALLGFLSGDEVARFVTLRVGYEEALRRAQSDPTRGASRDPAFLASYFASLEATMASVPDSDLVLDTEHLDLDRCVAEVIAFTNRTDRRTTPAVRSGSVHDQTSPEMPPAGAEPFPGSEAPPDDEGRARLEAVLAPLGAGWELFPCDPALADTARFCEAYGFSPHDTANTIVVVGKADPRVFAACVVLAPHRLDVNRTVKARLGTRKASFASADETRELTGMEIGGVTPLGLPGDLPLWVDAAVMERERIVLGGGSRSWKVIAPPAILLEISNVEVVAGLATAVQPDA